MRFRNILCLSLLACGLACGGSDGNTRVGSGFSDPAFSAVKVGDSEQTVQEKLGPPLGTSVEPTLRRLIYAEPKDSSKPFVRKEVIIREGKVAQKFNEATDEQ